MSANEVHKVGQVTPGTSSSAGVSSSGLAHNSAANRATGGSSHAAGGSSPGPEGDDVSFSHDHEDEHATPFNLQGFLGGGQASPGIVPQNQEPPTGGREPVKDNFTTEPVQERRSPGIVPRNRDLPTGGRQPVKDNFTQ